MLLKQFLRNGGLIWNIFEESGSRDWCSIRAGCIAGEKLRAGRTKKSSCRSFGGNTEKRSCVPDTYEPSSRMVGAPLFSRDHRGFIRPEIDVKKGWRGEKEDINDESGTNGGTVAFRAAQIQVQNPSDPLVVLLSAPTPPRPPPSTLRPPSNISTISLQQRRLNGDEGEGMRRSKTSGEPRRRRRFDAGS